MFILGDFQCELADRNKHQNMDFLTLFMSKWDEIHDKSDVFRYKIDKIREKVVSGYLLQLNPNRSSKRRTPEQIDDIRQPFDGEKFNFTKVSTQEIILKLRKDIHDTVHSIIVNVSPISRYHSLICPSVEKCLPQVVTKESLELTLQLMFLAKDRTFRIGFNSLCGFASVNHLHYHILIEKHKLPVEIAKCKHLYGPVYCLNEEYPVPAFCFEVCTEKSIANMSNEIYKLIDCLLKKSIAHNIFMTRGLSLKDSEAEVIRVLVWPRKSTAGVKQMTAFNVALLELSGLFPIYDADDFERLQCTDLENELKKWRIDNFEDLCKEIKSLY
ncbi:hypothetical protein ABMA27_003226 [Loxostege sticticalis]|uniref:GDP-D-glucose phosphorylase 1 n=1 Tax=Loxostege sticticalis TaxID=481309 RepID=A0ABR3HSD7_LOXSC